MSPQFSGIFLRVSNPVLYVIAGPNGAGKTTFAGEFFMRKKQNHKLAPMTLKALKALQNAALRVAQEHSRLGLPLIVSEKKAVKKTLRSRV